MKEEVYQGELNDLNIRKIFEGAGDFNIRELNCSGQILYAYAIDGLTSGNTISEYIIKPISEELTGKTTKELYDSALRGVVVNSVAKPCNQLTDAAYMLVNGFCVVWFPGTGAIAFEAKTGEKRGLSGPELEHTAKGPKDAFVETIRTNTSLIRRHLRTPDLRLYETKVGKRSLTNVSVVWIAGITNPKFVDKMKKRLDSIDIDGFLTSATVEEYVTGSRKTPFPLLQYTERTDRFCQALLGGRVGLLVDGLPLGYLAPVDIGYLMNSPEDHGRDYISSSWVRILRYGALLIGLLLPGLYISLTVYHTELLPENFLQLILDKTENLLYSSIAEVLGLLLAFELLQESGKHLPQSIGQSVSIIGGIVVGSAAIDAGLLSPIALIVVSIAGICGFVLPNRDFASAVRVCRFVLGVLASIAGLTGMMIGIILLLIHLFRLKSLGVSYVIPFEPCLLQKRQINDKYRDKRMRTIDRRKQK